MAKSRWPWDTLDPMRRDYRGREAACVAEIVEGDKQDISNSSALLVWFDRPSVGTSMEIYLAWTLGIPVFVVDASDKPLSPWLIYHSTSIHKTIEEALHACEARLRNQGDVSCGQSI